jgi:FkbM family methyltransferase
MTRINEPMDYKTSFTCQIPNLHIIYKTYFGDKPIGSFVEVGAYDGITYSNTYGLAEMGWHGLYIEAIEEYYKNCYVIHSDHPNIDIVNACVGDGSKVELYIGGEYSTFDKDFMLHVPQGWGAVFDFIGKVKTVTLDALLTDYWNQDEIDLLVVDVEGSENAVLSGFTVAKWEPVMAIVECHEHHHNEWMRMQAESVNNYFAEAGYNKVYSDDLNNIYVRKNDIHIKFTESKTVFETRKDYWMDSAPGKIQLHATYTDQDVEKIK